MSSIKRKAHILKSEKSVAIPRHLIFFDTETTQYVKPNGDIVQSLKLGWACYWRRGYGRHLDREDWIYFKRPDKFWRFVMSLAEPKVKLWIIARNIVFDFTVCSGWRYLKKYGYRLRFFYNEATTAIISVRKKSSSLVFLDSTNWFVESLAKTGQRIGIPKIPIDFENCSESELSTYCKNDVRIELENFRLFIRFLEGNKVSRLCYTRGSTAMSAYLLRHYNTKIYIHNNKEAIDLERESYKGGRVECFFIGEKNESQHYILDVNSLYPCVMRNNPYPVRYVKALHGPTLETIREALKDKSVVAQVLIETDEPVYAVRKDRTVFPVGQFWTALCTPELKYALAFGHIREVGYCVLYEADHIFRSFVDKFYSLRLDFRSAGVAEYEELCKKMLNSLYGKFGQKAEQWRKIGLCPNEPDRVELLHRSGENRWTKLRYLLGELWELTGHEESTDSFPAIASHVTAYGRMYLWSLMLRAGEGNYLYCDTDSLIVNEKGFDNLQGDLSDTALGGLKVQETIDSLTIHGLKDYSTDTKKVIKGIRKNAVTTRAGVYEQELWPSFNGLLRHGDTDVYTISHITKSLSREYTKGVVTDSGVVLPFVFHVSDERPR